jgi:dephospho-CoA kinase
MRRSSRKNRAFVIGVTGGFGTGKSLVASIFRRLGAKVLDADSLAHELIRKGSPEHGRIVAAFGSSVLKKGGEIDRRKLAGLVFCSKAAVKKLNAIVHPAVVASIKKGIRRAGKGKVVVVDAPLLVEAGLAGLVDRIVVVRASRKKQIARAARAFRMTHDECMKRIKSQMPLKANLAAADFIIDNDGSRKETEWQSRNIWRRIAWI